jgi:hypothetical protein
MKKYFGIVCGLDGLLLCLPTNRWWPLMQFWIAVVMTAVTAMVWVSLKLADDP